MRKPSISVNKVKTVLFRQMECELDPHMILCSGKNAIWQAYAVLQAAMKLHVKDLGMAPFQELADMYVHAN